MKFVLWPITVFALLLSIQASTQEEVDNQSEGDTSEDPPVFIITETPRKGFGEGEFGNSSGLYIIFDRGSSLESPKFIAESDSMALDENWRSDNEVGHWEVSLGHRKFLGRNRTFRYEGRMRRTGLNMVPVSSVRKGRFETVEFHGGVSLDFLADPSGFAYIGSSVGYVRAKGQYQLEIGSLTEGIDGTDWTNTVSFEAGAATRITGNTGLRFAYNYTRFFSGFNFTTNSGSIMHLRPDNQHSVKIGIVHFFRKQ